MTGLPENAQEEFETFCDGYKRHSPIYVRQSEWDKIKDTAPPGDYIVLKD